MSRRSEEETRIDMKRFFASILFIIIICISGCSNQNTPADEVIVSWKDIPDSYGEYTGFEYMGYDFEVLDDMLWSADEKKMEYIGQLKVFGFESRERPDNFIIQYIPFQSYNHYTGAYCYYDETGEPLVISNKHCIWINSDLSLPLTDKQFCSFMIERYGITSDGMTDWLDPKLIDEQTIDVFSIHDVINENVRTTYFSNMNAIYGLCFYSNEIKCLYDYFYVYEKNDVLFIDAYGDEKYYALNDEWQKRIEKADLTGT